MRPLFAVVAILVAAFPFLARAEGNLATCAERLEPLQPDCGTKSADRNETKVDLPAPLGPGNAVNRPGRRSMEIAFNASFVP